MPTPESAPTSAKRFANGAAVAVFAVVMAIALLHEGFNDWTRSVDATFFGSTGNRFHPTLAICAAAAAITAWGIVLVVGSLISKNRHE